ncbi:MAG: hypothetical protein GY818_15135 [Planctomycetaceae bacterium]|nr:hypothetical protein [Planctomycetaceae bacterium]
MLNEINKKGGFLACSKSIAAATPAESSGIRKCSRLDSALDAPYQLANHWYKKMRRPANAGNVYSLFVARIYFFHIGQQTAENFQAAL